MSEPRFARATAVADTILWEGYVLYPYRSSSAKNRLRFNWGVVGPAEEPTLSSTVIVQPGTTELHLRVRFLRLLAREDGWDEAEPVQHDLTVELDALRRGAVDSPISRPGGIETGDDGTTRTRSPLEGRLVVEARPTVAGHDLVQVRVENRTPCPSGDRQDALRRSFVGTHVLVAAPGDAFVSLLEPPEELAGAAAALEQHRAWPVLVGPPPARDLVLASPVILYDYPAVATESVGDFYDGTEIDEMLALRVHTLTDAEKEEARRTDPRARAIIDRHDHLDPVTMAGLHGTIRDRPAAPVDPAPEWSDPGPDRALVGGRWVTAGAKVRLEPLKRADVHDMFLRGRTATVAEVVHDVDGAVHVAVTVDDDPAADLFDAQRRYLYFAPDELVALGGGHG